MIEPKPVADKLRDTPFAYEMVNLPTEIAGLKRGDEIIGNQTRVKVVKNKVSPPFKMAEFEILYGHGVSREGELIDLGVANNLVEKAGSWYSYNGDRIGQGKENVRVFLLENPEIADEIDRNLRDILLPKPDAATDAPDQDAAVGEA